MKHTLNSTKFIFKKQNKTKTLADTSFFCQRMTFFEKNDCPFFWKWLRNCLELPNMWPYSNFHSTCSPPLWLDRKKYMVIFWSESLFKVMRKLKQFNYIQRLLFSFSNVFCRNLMIFSKVSIKTEANHCNPKIHSLGNINCCFFRWKQK